MSETDIKHEIMLAISQRGYKVFNRPTGNFYTKNGNAYTPIKINVKGASDLQGHRSDGKCFYIECKTQSEYAALMSRIERGKTTEHDDDQINFINAMKSSGAIAGFCCSVEQAEQLINNA